MILEKYNSLDYYSVGDVNNLVLSNSALKEIDPDLGGHPAKFLEFFKEDKEKKSSKALDNGTNIHKYCEDRSNFAIADTTKPEGKAGEIADNILEQGRRELIELDYVPDIKDLFSKARTEIEYYKDRNDDSTWETFRKTGAVDYISFAYLNKDKIIVSKNDKIILENCSESIRNHSLANYYLFGNNINWKRFKEQSIFWKYGENECKVKPDNFIIDYDREKLILIDIKSHGKGSGYDYCPRTSDYNPYKGALALRVYVTPFERNKVYNQLAFYKNGLLQNQEIKELSEKGFTWEYKIIVVETIDPFNTYVFDIDYKWVNRGLYEVNELIARINWHISSRVWNRHMEEYITGLEIKAPFI